MEYDALNRVTKMIYPEDVDSERKELIPTYNRAGALESVVMDGDNYVNHIAYNAQGKRLLIAYQNGVMTRYSYDSLTFHIVRQRSETYTKSGWTYTSDGSVQQDTAHLYDLIGNIIQLNEKTTGCGVGGTDALTRNFAYDPLYRAISGTGRENSPTITPIWDDRYRSTNDSITTAYTQNYEYDKLGNIQVFQHLGNTDFTRNFNYTSSNNQLQSIDIGATNYAFSYDACGNQVSETTSRHFEWDFGNRLRSFYVQTGTSEPTQYAQYLYDAGGTRVKKLVRTSGGGYTSRVYIDDVFEYLTDGTDEQNTLHIMDDQTRVAMVRLGYAFSDTTPAIKYNLDDYLSNSTLLLEISGALVNKEEYYPFGETSFGSYGKKRYRFTGKERDSESGLYYYGARYYSPWTCRFISVDPLAADYPYLTPYNYAGNKPITFKDIDGMQSDGDQPVKQDAPTQNNDNSEQSKNVVYGTSLGSKIKNWITINTRALFNKAVRNNLNSIKDNENNITIIQNNSNATHIKDGGRIINSEVDGVKIWEYSKGGRRGQDDSSEVVTEEQDNTIDKEVKNPNDNSEKSKKNKSHSSKLNKLKWGFSFSLEQKEGNFHFMSIGIGNYRTHNMLFIKHREQRRFNHNSVDPLFGIKWKTRGGKINFIYFGTAIRKRNGQSTNGVIDLTRNKSQKHKVKNRYRF